MPKSENIFIEADFGEIAKRIAANAKFDAAMIQYILSREVTILHEIVGEALLELHAEVVEAVKDYKETPGDRSKH